MAERDFFFFHAIQVQEVFYCKVEPSQTQCHNAQLHELQHGCGTVYLLLLTVEPLSVLSVRNESQS